VRSNGPGTLRCRRIAVARIATEGLPAKARVRVSPVHGTCSTSSMGVSTCEDKSGLRQRFAQSARLHEDQPAARLPRLIRSRPMTPSTGPSTSAGDTLAQPRRFLHRNHHADADAWRTQARHRPATAPAVYRSSLSCSRGRNRNHLIGRRVHARESALVGRCQTNETASIPLPACPPDAGCAEHGRPNKAPAGQVYRSRQRHRPARSPCEPSPLREATSTFGSRVVGFARCA
jgi:hypothetical protein